MLSSDTSKKTIKNNISPTSQIPSATNNHPDHVIIPNDAKIIRNIKGSWTKTKLNFTIDRKIIPDKIFSVLDTDPVRCLIQRNGLLSSEDYLLVVPSDFDIRNADWEVIETNVRITEKTVKLSIPIPAIFEKAKSKLFSFGIFNNYLFFIITQKR